MELGPYEIALIGVGGTIAGALVGALVGYRLSLSLSHITSKQKAALKLREAFRDELLALIPSQHAINEDLPSFLERSFQKHRVAIFDFSFYLKHDEKDEFLTAWYEYYCPEQNRSDRSVPCFEQYSCRGFNIQEKHDVKLKIRQRIESILKFTENQQT